MAELRALSTRATITPVSFTNEYNWGDFKGDLSSRVSRRTLQRDLRVMLDKGLIIEKASSPTDPTKIYILAGKLSGRVATSCCGTEL